MLRMGAFTAEELSQNSGEQLPYVRNLIGRYKSYFLAELSRPQTGKIGRPEVLYTLRSGVEPELMKTLRPLYSLTKEPENLDTQLPEPEAAVEINRLGPPRIGRGERKSFRFVDVLDPSQRQGRDLCETRVDLVWDDEGQGLRVSSSKNELGSEKQGSQSDVIMLDDAKATAGLAQIYAMSSENANQTIAVVNLRNSSAQIGLISGGKVLHTRSVAGRHGFDEVLSKLAETLKDIHSLHSSLMGNQDMKEVCFFGDAGLVNSAISSLEQKFPMHYSSVKLDQLPHITFSEEETSASLASIAPKIGYALEHWYSERQNPAISQAQMAPKLENKTRRQPH